MVHLRPGAEEFIHALSKHFALSIWTASYGLYTKNIVNKVFGSVDNLEFLLTREDCDLIVEDDGYDAFVKDTNKIMDLGWCYEDFLVVDDRIHLVKSVHNNVIEVKPYYGSALDRELFLLKDRILSLAGEDLKDAAKI